MVLSTIQDWIWCEVTAMIKVTSTFTINKIKLQILSDAAVMTLIQTAEALKTGVQQAQVIPRDTGNLQGESFRIDTENARSGIVRLVHSTPYARRLYFNPDGMIFHQEAWTTKSRLTGKEIKHDGNPNAKDHWFEDWMPGGSRADFVPKTFKRLYRRNAKLK